MIGEEFHLSLFFLFSSMFVLGCFLPEITENRDQYNFSPVVFAYLGYLACFADYHRKSVVDTDIIIGFNF